MSSSALTGGSPARLWLLGCGNMGGALLARWQAAGLVDAAIIDPSPRLEFPGVPFSPTAPAGNGPDILVLAVKPQLLAGAVAGLADRLRADTLIVSIMAGTTCATLMHIFGSRPLVRTMPNTPARLGKGVTALWAEGASPADRARAEALMAAAGATVWLDAEDQFDAVTAVSGSGPAYVFAFIEALTAAAIEAGLAPALAATLARATVTGAAMLADEPGADPTVLRVAVTSPGGTTAAGLGVLTGGDALVTLLSRTVAAATVRSRELGKLD
jgi:pyrroline-5-carboxylate reductase